MLNVPISQFTSEQTEEFNKLVSKIGKIVYVQLQAEDNLIIEAAVAATILGMYQTIYAILTAVNKNNLTSPDIKNLIINYLNNIIDNNEVQEKDSKTASEN